MFLVTSVMTGFCGGPGSWMNSEALDTEEPPSFITETHTKKTQLHHISGLSLINILSQTVLCLVEATDCAPMKNTGRLSSFLGKEV